MRELEKNNFGFLFSEMIIFFTLSTVANIWFSNSHSAILVIILLCVIFSPPDHDSLFFY